MSKWRFPMLVWPLWDGQLMGEVVDAGVTVFGDDIDSMIRGASSRLQKMAKAGKVRRPGFAEPRLEVVEEEVQSGVVEEDRFFALPFSQRVSVVSLFGRTTAGAWQSYLPQFDAGFSYYRPEQRLPLTRYLLHQQVHSAGPEALVRLGSQSPPTLHIVEIPEPKPPSRQAGDLENDRSSSWLRSVADPYPTRRRSDDRRSVVLRKPWGYASWTKTLEWRLKNASDKSTLLVAEPGSGAEYVIAAAAADAYHALRRAPGRITIWRSATRRLFSGARYLGEWQEICEELVSHLRDVNGILWLADVADLLRFGGKGTEDSAAAYLTRFVAKGEIKIVGTVTLKEWESIQLRAPAFASCFFAQTLPPLNDVQTRQALDEMVNVCASALGMDVEEGLAEGLQRLLRRLMPHEGFPVKAIRLLESMAREVDGGREDGLTLEAAQRELARATGLAPVLLREDERLDPAELRATLTREVMGQPDAVDRVASVFETYKAALNDPKRPVATMLFAGPTGVGKTATARALAAYVFGAGGRKPPLVRIDMSELQHPAQIQRLIGGADGQVGSFVRQMREHPFSVVLFDEIEKAHPAFFDVLMTVLDEGLLEDALGRETSFRSSVVIMTTNVGAVSNASLGFGATGTDGFDAGALRRAFRPEFLNRVDHIVRFEALDEATVRKIATRELARVHSREGLRARSVEVRFDESVVDFLVSVGFDARYGARPMQAAIEEHVVAPLARYLVTDGEGASARRIIASMQDKGLVVAALHHE